MHSYKIHNHVPGQKGELNKYKLFKEIVLARDIPEKKLKTGDVIQIS